MKNLEINQLKSIHHRVRESSSAELCFVVLLVFPFFISVYAGAITNVGLVSWSLESMSLSIIYSRMEIDCVVVMIILFLKSEYRLFRRQ